MAAMKTAIILILILILNLNLRLVRYIVFPVSVLKINVAQKLRFDGRGSSR